jgi:hypothetical protein
VPLEELQFKIFSEASIWLDKVHSHTAKLRIAAEGFLTLLMTLRITFLQYSVFMQKLVPNHPVWKYQIFSDTLYMKF